MFLICMEATYHHTAVVDETLYLEVIINGLNTDKIAEFVHTENDWQITYDDFIRLGLKIDLPRQERVSLSDIKGSEVAYDAELQRLFITVPSKLLPLQRFSANMPQGKSGQSRRDSGAFINYNIVSSSGNMASQMSSLWHEYHFFTNDFILVSSGIYQKNTDAPITSGYTRFETYYQRDNEFDLSQTTVGDVINATPNWGRSIRMAGIRVARNYELAPTLITYPLPEFYGESALPGSVDLIINDQLRWREPIASGPFLINMAPYLSGGGIAQVITTNAQGQQVQQSVNFYVTSELLAQDMLDYDVTIGFRRKDFGLVSNAYHHRPVISSSIRYGVNNYMTPQILIQGGEGLTLGGVGFTLLAGSFGVIDIAESSSNYQNQHGEQASFAYNYSYKKVGVNARYLKRYGNYRDLGTQDSLTPFIASDDELLSHSEIDTQMQIALSVHDNTLGGFNLGLFRTIDDKNERRALVNVSWNQYFSSDITTFVNFSKQLYGRRENLLSLTVSIPFGNSGQASVFTQRDMKDELHTQVQAIKNTPYTEGFGWGINMEDSAEKNRYFIGEWRNKYSDLSVSAYYGGDRKEYTKTLNGALVFMDHDIYATRYVTDSFALIDTNRKDIPIMVGNQLVGETNNNGKLLVSDLSSYLENRIGIDPIQLPANATIDSIEQLVIPRRKGGVHVKFPIIFSRSALVEVVTADNEPLPVGAVLTTRNGETTYVAGWDGEVYIENLAGPLALYWDEGECIVELKPAKDKTIALPRIGPFICQPAWGDE